MMQRAKLAALAMLSAAVMLGVGCATERAAMDDGAPRETAVSEPILESSEALQSDAEEALDEVPYAADDERLRDDGWGDRWHYCRPFRHCVFRYGYHACARWMPRRAYYCGGYPGGGYPGGGYPGGGYPGGGYPGGGYPGGGEYPGGGGEEGYPGGGDPGGGYPGGGYPGGGHPGEHPGGGDHGHGR